MREIIRLKQIKSHKCSKRKHYEVKDLMELAKIYITLHDLRFIVSVCIVLRTKRAVQYDILGLVVL